MPIAPARSCELGSQRPLATTLAELAIGRETLVRAFGERFAPILVPPWNRIADEVVAALPGAGYRGLSAFGPRGAARPAPGLMQCNTPVDLIAWRSGRAFIGAERAVARTVEHLAARREGRVDPEEPTGILTHHLDLTNEAWAFLDELSARTRAHAAAHWLSAERVFGELST